MREIVLDTETTGRDPAFGDRIVEIGAVELVNKYPTGRTLQLYLNPEREMDQVVIAIHGLTNEFLADKPKFSEVADTFLEFIGDARLVIHNASFDMKFLNAELAMLGFATMPATRALDTLEMARRKFPGSPASLDALCRRFNVNNTGRQFHGALLDAQLLTEVYRALTAGEQASLFGAGSKDQATSLQGTDVAEKTVRPVRHFPANDDELSAHAAFIAGIKNAIWQKLTQNETA